MGNATSNKTPRRPHRPSSLPHYHRSPFSLLLSATVLSHRRGTTTHRVTQRDSLFLVLAALNNLWGRHCRSAWATLRILGGDALGGLGFCVHFMAADCVETPWRVGLLNSAASR